MKAKRYKYWARFLEICFLNLDLGCVGIEPGILGLPDMSGLGLL